MQATPEVNPDTDARAGTSPYFDRKTSKLPEYAYRAAILAAVILLLWTAA